MTEPATFQLEDGSVYERIPGAEFPDGDQWDSVEVERRLAERPRSLVSVTSQNGWPANDRSLIASYTIPGTSERIALRAGDCSVILLHFLGWWNTAIEPLAGAVLDDWGYAERTIRGSSTTLSNHASGTAADANATKHPLATHTLTKPELAKVKQQLTVYRGALRHGAFYTGRVDEMHAEIDSGPSLVRQVADDIRAGRLGGAAIPEGDDEMDPQTRNEIAATNENVNQVRSYLGLLMAAIQGVAAKVGTVDVDEGALAQQLAPLLAPMLTAHAGQLSQADLDAVAKAAADEQARRLAS